MGGSPFRSLDLRQLALVCRNTGRADRRAAAKPLDQVAPTSPARAENDGRCHWIARRRVRSILADNELYTPILPRYSMLIPAAAQVGRMPDEYLLRLTPFWRYAMLGHGISLGKCQLAPTATRAASYHRHNGAARSFIARAPPGVAGIIANTPTAPSYSLVSRHRDHYAFDKSAGFRSALLIIDAGRAAHFGGGRLFSRAPPRKSD